jgi:DNA polymerase III epsilon subunit-like protein
MALTNFLVCDLETTSDKPLNAEVLTGSFLYLDKDLDVIDRYDFNSRPRVWGAEADKASAIHGITYAQAFNFTLHDRAMLDLSKWLDSLSPSYFCCHANRTIFGSFSTYDYAVLTSSLFYYDLHWSLYRSCPRKYILSTHSLAKYLKLPTDYNLKSLASFFGINDFLHHDATADTKVCYEILKNILPKVDIEEFLNIENFKLNQEVVNGLSEKAPTIKQSKRKARKV